MGLYEALVIRSDMYTDREVQEANYENIITTANNGISTFRALEQVQQMLGDLGDDIANNDGRLLAEEVTVCEDTDVCKDPSSTCNCGDEGYFCDCEPNYQQVAMDMIQMAMEKLTIARIATLRDLS